METFQPWLMPVYSTVVGIIIGLLYAKIQSLVTRKKEDKDKEAAIAEGMVCLLRKQLFEYYGTYEFQDSIPASEWSDIEQTHDVYNKLGGNHTGDRLFDEMKKKHIGG